MTFRSRIWILITGIVLFPPFVGLFLFYIADLIQLRQGETATFIKFVVWKDDKLLPALKKGSLSGLEPPEDLPLVYLSDERKILLSNIGGLKAGSTLEYGDFANLYRTFYDSAAYNQVITEHVYAGGKRAGTVLFFLTESPGAGIFKFRGRIMGFYVLLFILAAASVVAGVILRRLSRSIVRLEAAAKRIARGDFDFVLVPEGRDEFTSLTESFDRMRVSLKENQAQRARFLMAVSHDLKTPLTSIRGYLEAIEDGMATDEATFKSYVDIIRKKAELLEERILELIDFVRLETGEWRMKNKPIDLRSFLLELGQAFRQDTIVEGRIFTFSIDIPDGIVVNGDPALLLRVFENIFGNALRYTEEGNGISFRAAQGRDGIVIEIEDSGKGIPRDELGLIFEPFYRGNSSRREPGFGLGLSTVKSIVESHGWTIVVDSEIGKWTRFTVRIPR